MIKYRSKGVYMLYKELKKILEKFDDDSMEDDPVPYIKRTLRKYGFKKIGEGATRIAFGNGKIVVKYGDAEENDTEMVVWNRVKKHKIWKWAVVPLFKHVRIAKNGFSFVIGPQANKLKRINSNQAFPREGCRIVGPKRLQMQWDALDTQFDDCHDENIGLFGDAVCLFDLNFAYGTLRMTPAKEWAEQVNMTTHKKKYRRMVKKAIMSLGRVNTKIKTCKKK